jgi:Protein of unknown function (DUF3631)
MPTRNERCVGGFTQIERILTLAQTTNAETPVAALVFVGDAMEESADVLVGRAAKVGCPIFIFHESLKYEPTNLHGDDAFGSEQTFRAIAAASKGAATGTRLELFLMREAEKQKDPELAKYWRDNNLVGLGLNTLLLDEVDQYKATGLMLRILHAAHRKRGVFWSSKAEDVPCFSPLAVFRLHDPRHDPQLRPLVSRSILIQMQKRDEENPAHTRVDWCEDNRLHLPALKQQIAQLVQEHAAEFKKWRPQPDMAGVLARGNRRADNWRPLIAIAELAGGNWPEAAQRIALTPLPEPEVPIEPVPLSPSERVKARIMDWLQKFGRASLTDIYDGIFKHNIKAYVLHARLGELDREGIIRSYKDGRTTWYELTLPYKPEPPEPPTPATSASKPTKPPRAPKAKARKPEPPKATPGAPTKDSAGSAHAPEALEGDTMPSAPKATPAEPEKQAKDCQSASVPPPAPAPAPLPAAEPRKPAEKAPKREPDLNELVAAAGRHERWCRTCQRFRKERLFGKAMNGNFLHECKECRAAYDKEHRRPRTPEEKERSRQSSRSPSAIAQRERARRRKKSPAPEQPTTTSVHKPVVVLKKVHGMGHQDV